MAGIVIDDLVLGEQLPADGVPDYPESCERLDRLLEEYQQQNLTAHPKKTFKKEEKAIFWGFSVDGKRGSIRANPARLLPLMELTVQTARLGIATVSLLEVLCGCWISILQIKRRLLCLVDVLYECQRGRDRADIVELSAEAVQELWTLCLVAPVAVCSMRCQSLAEIFCTDASNDYTASVWARVPQVFSRELQRHCLSRGVWNKLLTPWQSWLKLHGQLYETEELPDGVPLVSHPLWVLLARVLQFKFGHCKSVNTKRHINVLELQAVLELERRLAVRQQDVRYCLGSDSQVTLAALVKGRSSSKQLNEMLQSSLGYFLGAGLQGNYGYIPSLCNAADDPTRGQKIRSPSEPLPQFLEAAFQGSFAELDSWLGRLGFDPMKLAELPFDTTYPIESEFIRTEHLGKLRSVQKADRLQRFDEAQAKPEASDVSPNVEKSTRNTSREHAEPEGQTKIEKKTPTRATGQDEKEGHDSPVVVSKGRVAPPAIKPSEKKSFPIATVSGHASANDSDVKVRAGSPTCEESSRAPLLSDAAKKLLALFPGSQFILPGGRRGDKKFSPCRKGFLDLYSGKCGVAKQLARRHNVWVLTFDVELGSGQDLLDSSLQSLLLQMVEEDCFLGVGAAPECGSFSRAVRPPVRSRDCPSGLPYVTERMAVKIERGNKHASFTLQVLELCRSKGLAYWLENPDGSFLWLLYGWIKSGLGQADHCYRLDQCRFHTPWRKRTRIATNTALAGHKDLCQGGHSHLRLVGHSAVHRCCWTKVAQTYPRALCMKLADAMAAKAAVQQVMRSRQRLNIGGCAKCNSRVGEASHPGPRRTGLPQEQRDGRQLLEVAVVDPVTHRLQLRVWNSFEDWLRESLSESAVEQVFLCPAVAVGILRRYGVHLFSTGKGLYELRHVLVLAQQRHPHIRASMAPAWHVVSQWEEVQPTKHRTPLPEPIYKAMVSLAVLLGWKRFAAALVLGVEGITRIGEVLKARRCDLVLPSDLFEDQYQNAFLKIRRPKTLRRGKGRVQHAKVDHGPAVKFLENIYGKLDEFLPLFPLSSTAFRRRWDLALDRLLVPKDNRPTPASIRGGGAVIQYRRGTQISEIMWKMRLVSQTTLESYLQEVAADSLMLSYNAATRNRIRSFASLFHAALRSPG